MRALRAGLIAAVAAAVLLTPTAASAQIDDITIGTARLGPNGATVDVPVNVVCDVGYYVGLVDVEVVQSGGRKLAHGTTTVLPDFPPGVPCTGAPQVATVVTVATTTSFAYKVGKATATAQVIVTDLTFNFVLEDAGPTTIQIKR
jgi:hypothetical protein